MNPPGLDEIEDFLMNDIHMGYGYMSDDDGDPAHFDADGNYYFNEDNYEYSSSEDPANFGSEIEYDLKEDNREEDGNQEQANDQGEETDEDYGIGWETDEARDDYTNMVIGEVDGMPITQMTSFVFQNQCEIENDDESREAEILNTDEVAGWIIDQFTDGEVSSTASSPAEG